MRLSCFGSSTFVRDQYQVNVEQISRFAKGRRMPDGLKKMESLCQALVVTLLLCAGMCSAGAYAQQVEPSLPISQRFTINLAAGVPEYVADATSTSNDPQSHWWFQNTNDSTNYSSPSFVESSDTAATWKQVGLPYDANIPSTFINQVSGGGQDPGNNNWYRLHFKVDPKYKGQKFLLNIEGSHTGLQVFINGTLMPGVSAVAANSQATHVVGFIPVQADMTPYIVADGSTDNVIAIDVSRNAKWYEQPQFCGAFRFGQDMAGLFRNVYMYVTNPVHIPLNVYSNTKTWGTYVGTVSEVPAAEGTATAASAVVNVQTNVLNEGTTAQTVTLTTQIVDQQGNVVVTASPIVQTIQPMTAATLPSGPTPMFNQLITVPNPTLWYPNNSIYGTPYMYKVYSIVSVNGAVVDSFQSPLGIRTLTWDSDFPYFNGQSMHLWGGSSRYDYPALGSSVPDEVWWRDLAEFAASGGNVWRPGHCTASEEFVEAADAYGVMVDQPSGDGEGHWNATSNPSADDLQLKQELHRDMIIRDRSHPSILDWEADNGGNNTPLADELMALSTTWDNIAPRYQADRGYNPLWGQMAECDGAGCEVAMKGSNPNYPAFGAEYWDNMGTGRGTVITLGGVSVSAYDYELAYSAPYIDDWRQGRAANTFGMAHWYFADTPGEISTWAEFQNQPLMINQTDNGNGLNNPLVRSLGYSMVDQNRFPRLLYYVYQANWVPYSIKPVVHLAHHWNRAYEYTQGTKIQVNGFSNCPKVRLLINNVAKDPVTGEALADVTPNPWNINSHSDLSQSTTIMPGQVHWMVNWAPGTATAQCIGEDDNPVSGVSHTLTTAGAENKIVLTAIPEVVKPDGTSFQWTANGSDAAFVQAEVQDAQGNWVPTAMDNVTFTVTGTGGTYMGGTQQLVADPQWTNDYQDTFSKAHANDVGNLPYGFFHAPGDPELNFEGGLQKIALRSSFTPGTVTVTASALGLGTSNAVTLTSVAPPPPPQTQPPAIIVPPVDVATTVGYPATFTVSASGGGTLSYQWYQGGSQISGANSSTYVTPDTTLAQNNETFTVTVSSNFGSVSSNPVTLTVDAAASVAIATQPAAQTVVVGQSATLTVAATGSPALNYAWYMNGSLVQSGPLASYTTPVLTATGTETLYVIVSNPVGHLQSNNAVLTIVAPTPVSIVTQPAATVAVANNQPVQISAVVAGSAPYSYQWNFTPTGGAATIVGASTQLSPTISYVIQQFSSANVGAYTVTVNNAAAVPITSTVSNLTLAPPGVNLALNKTATASSVQGNNTANLAVDGVISENSRWGSATANAPPTPPVTGVDPSWLQVDLGSSVAFNTVVIYWENAYATQYAIQYTNGDPTVAANWQTAFSNPNGMGGIDQESFPTVTARYIRVLGQQRETQYGYSIIEFQVYNVAQCGGASERYTVIPATATLPSLVTDNQSGMTWTRTIKTDTAAGSQFTGVSAVNYCSSISMRVPTASEALGISGNSDATCAFPGVWSTWTSTVDPSDATRTAIVNYDGTQAYQVTVNYPGETLCASGTQLPSAPVIQVQPQSATANVGQTETFTVVASGTPTPTYQWFENGTAISGAINASYTTGTLAAADNGDTFYVVVTNSVSSVTSATAKLTVTTGSQCTTSPAAPTGLTATPTSSTAIGLSWTAATAPTNCSISSYSVYGSTTSGFTPSASTLIAANVTSTSYPNTGLKASQTYYYVVEAVDSNGNSPASTQASATTASGTAADFTFGTSPAALTITAGSSGTETATVTPVNGFATTSTVTFACSGLPAGASCSFSPATVNAAGNIVSSLTVATTTSTAALHGKPNLFFPGSVLAAALCFFGWRRRRVMQLMILAVSLCGLAALAGCGGSSNLVGKTSAPTTSTITVTATSGSLQHSATFTLTVQPANSAALAPGTSNRSNPIFPVSLLAGVFCYFSPKKRYSMQRMLLASSALGMFLIAGCGGTSIAPVQSQPAAPTITTQPASQSVTAGQTASFSVVASGAAPLTYQWQSNGTAISGANAASYTTPAAVAANSGTTYKVVVTNTVGSVTSNAAVLTVTTSACSVVPAAPTGLTATASSSTVIGLGWTAVTPPANCAISSYSVYRSTTSGFTPSAVNLIASGLTSPAYSDTGLSPSTTYYYVVEASDTVGSSVPSAQATAQTMAAGASCTAAPSAPAGVTATASSSSAIGLSWTAVTPPANCAIGSYSVYRSTTSGFTPSAVNLIAGGLTSPAYSDTGLSPSTTYYYVVEASDTVGSSVPSAQASAQTKPAGASCTTAPLAPAGVTATASSSSVIGLSWTAVTPPANCTISSYSVYGSTTSGFTPSSGNLIASGVAGTSYSNTGLAASTTYYYAVEAVDTDSSSAPSAQASATTQAQQSYVGYVSINAGGGAVSNSGGGDNPFVADEDYSTGGTLDTVTAAITIPASVAASAAPAAVYQSARQGTVTYTIPNLVAGTNYIVRLHFAELYFSAAGSRRFDVAINGTPVLTDFDIFATAGGQYTAVVKQFTEAANNSGQIVIAFTDGAANQPMFNGIEVLDATPCSTLPTAPTGLTATAAYPSVVNLNWSAVAPPADCAISSYNVYGGTTANPTALIGSKLTTTTFSNTGLTGSTTYYYTVEAVDAEGNSVPSAQATATTPAPVVIAPATSLTAVGSSPQQIDLRWVPSTAPAANTAPVNYAIYRSTTQGFTPSAANLMGTTLGITNYVDNNYPATLTPPTGPGVQPGTTYYYQVIASTLSGISEAATASATSLPETPSAAAPAALTGLTAMAEDANEIDLIWNSTNSGWGTAVTTYNVYRSTKPNFTPSGSNLIGNVKTNWYQDVLVSASTQYYYQVTANNRLGGSPSSPTVTATTPALNPNQWGGAPFFDAGGLPAKQNVVMLKFLNRTNGKYTDDQITWWANINGVSSQYTLAQQPYFDMPANPAGRMYFYLNDPTLAEDNTDYWDYIEFTVGSNPNSINVDTTRVDALGVKLAMQLTCNDGPNNTVGTNIATGETLQVFKEDRAVTFQRYANDVPSTPGGNFQDDLVYAPYRIIEPGGAGFNAVVNGAPGADMNYYADYINAVWAFNGFNLNDVPLATSNADGIAASDLSAAIYRHTAPTSGTVVFDPTTGNLNPNVPLSAGLQGNPAVFYQQDPYDHYAQWIDAQDINNLAYGFPYNDNGGFSSDISCANPNTLLVAIGW